jgi:hypothetical protein
MYTSPHIYVCTCMYIWKLRPSESEDLARLSFFYFLRPSVNTVRIYEYCLIHNPCYLIHISRKFSPHFMPAHQYTVTDIGRQSHRPVIFLYVNKLLLPLIAFSYAYICEDPEFWSMKRWKSCIESCQNEQSMNGIHRIRSPVIVYFAIIRNHIC